MSISTANRIIWVLAMGTSWGLLFLSMACMRYFPGGPVRYQSPYYVIYQLQEGDKPEILAHRFMGDEKRGWVINEANPGVSFMAGKLIAIPLTERNKGGIESGGYQLIPILSYHHFADRCNAPLCMTAEVFDGQMRYLKENGFHAITPEELLDFVSYRHALPRRSVLLTIDDGYRSAYKIAYPILKNYGFSATLFIYTDFVGVSPGAITWDQLREMKANGFTVGSHSVSHCDLTRRGEAEDSRAYLARVESELKNSKRIIDDELSQNTIFLAYPYGRRNREVLEITRRLGYRLAVTVIPGSNPFFTDPLDLKRTQILSRKMADFPASLKTFHQFKDWQYHE